MRKVSQAIYDRIDNAVYGVQSDEWWQPGSPWYQMIVTFDPARVGYAKKILFERLKIDPKATAALEVGCGGGFMTEEIARMGFATTGVDPSERSVRVAAEHARENGLVIRYKTGAGESLRSRTAPSAPFSVVTSWNMSATCPRSSPRSPGS